MPFPTCSLSFSSVTYFSKADLSVFSVGAFGKNAVSNFEPKTALLAKGNTSYLRKEYQKALTLEDIAKIYDYAAQNGSIEERCRDYWIFNYLCNGINVKDLCLLKYQNIKGDFIVIQRAKTIRTRREKPEFMMISLKDDAKQIIAKWGQRPPNADKYVFPCLQPGMTLDQVRNQLKMLLRLINDHMKTIADELGIGKKVTTSYTRHSFAAILKNSGVPTEFVGEALGHSSLATRKSYLAGFEQDSRAE